jgi:hypothetical protein
VARPLDWDWFAQDPGPKVFGIYQKMIGIRKQHPALRSPNFYPSKWDESHTQPDEHGFGIDRSRNVVVYHRWDTASDGQTERYYIALNFSKDDQQISWEVPDGNGNPWQELIGNTVATTASGRLQVTVG